MKLWAFLAVAGLLAAAEYHGDTDKDRARILARRNWWSFQKVVRPEPPKLNSPWVRTAIDAFLLEALQAKSLKPSPEESKLRLLRRVTLDVTGLPPKPEEASAFLNDKRADAYDRLVDRLMASTQYGERWAQRWLDVARYADTNGFEHDLERTHAWRYRDYVVRSFNSGKPYDVFLKEQIAGDEIWPGQPDPVIAVGFNRAGPEHLTGGNQDVELNRQEVLVEMTAGVSNVFLGLTMNCARCHNHKFDPILQTDYYRLQAVFGGTEGKEVPLASAEEKARYDAARKAYEARLKPVQDEITAIEKPYKEAIIAERRAKLDPAVQALLDVPKDKLSEADREKQKNAKDQITPSWDEVLARVPKPELERRSGLRRQLHAIELDEPAPPAAAYAVVNREKPEDTNVLKVGDHRMKLGTVPPGLPLVLTANNAKPVPLQAAGRRTVLAEWLAQPDHPLTARVMVNRIWQFRMGRGIVGTPNDFGVMGERPTNPKLLDWLAAEFVSNGWNIKAIDRLILTSSAYRQASARNAAGEAVDPDNKLYWRMNRRRLEGEAIRDSVLSVSGMLNLEVGGPPIRVPIEKEVYDSIFTEYENDNLWPLPKDRSQIYRRSLYLLNKRTVRLPMLANFDQPDAMTSCAYRPVSTHALQALSLINSDFMAEQSAAFAKRVEQAGTALPVRIQRAYQLALARPPKPAEITMARDFFTKGGTLQEFCLALLNRNEFIYIP